MKILLLIILLSVEGLACGAPSFVKGQVTVDYRPVSKARVTLQAVNGGGIEGTTLTSTFGYYSILVGPCGGVLSVVVQTKQPAIFEQPVVTVDGSGEDNVVNVNGTSSFINALFSFLQKSQ